MRVQRKMLSHTLGILIVTAVFTLKLAPHSNGSSGITFKSEDAENYPLLIDRQPMHAIPEQSSSADMTMSTFVFLAIYYKLALGEVWLHSNRIRTVECPRNAPQAAKCALRYGSRSASASSPSY